MLLQKRRRHAFTLIELLVVITLVIALAGIVALVVPGISDQRKVSRGADQLQGWLLIAKQSALRDRSPRGLRLIPDASNPDPSMRRLIRELQYIEVPENYTPPLNSILTVQQSPLPLVPMTATNYSPTPNQVVVTGDITPYIQPGDFIEFTTTPVSIYQIAGPGHWPWLAMPPNAPMFDGTVTRFSVTTPIKEATVEPFTMSSNFRFIRSAKPLLGEEPLRLPKGVFIDPNGLSLLPPNPPTQLKGYEPPLDILFAPSGQVVTSGANATGRIILHVRDDENVGTPTLITIYSRTGSIAAHPVNTDPSIDGGNPYAFTSDGKSSGL